MSHLTTSLLATTLIAGCVGRASAEVRYRLDFEATWSAESHPIDFPPGPHFSALIGGVHSDRVALWEVGGLASPGIEFMAEGGTTFTHAAEVEALIAAGDAREVVRGSNINLSPGSGFANFSADAENQFLSLTSMIAPSPDWFVGVHSLHLVADGAWRREIVAPLYALDAGTDDGATYQAADVDSNLRQPISRLDNGLFDPAEPIGAFIITLLPPALAGDADADNDVDLEDFAVLRDAMGIATLEGPGAGDFDLSGVVDLRDFSLLKGNFGISAAVPEPGTFFALALTTVVVGVADWRRRRRSTPRKRWSLLNEAREGELPSEAG